MSWIIFVLLGALIILVLAIIAYRLLCRVKALEDKQQAERQQQAQEVAKHRTYLKNSIRILSQGVVDDQLSLTEAAIRISVLLDNLPVSDDDKESYSAFYQLAEATSHIPILEAWKNLPAKEKFTFDQQRLAAEEKYGDFVVDAAKRLMNHQFS